MDGGREARRNSNTDSVSSFFFFIRCYDETIQTWNGQLMDIIQLPVRSIKISHSGSSVYYGPRCGRRNATVPWTYSSDARCL